MDKLAGGLYFDQLYFISFLFFSIFFSLTVRAVFVDIFSFAWTGLLAGIDGRMYMG